jgi:hypothetical protein
MTKTLHDRLTLDELRATESYFELTPKQQKLVEVFIETNGDRVKAVMAAYATKSEKNARVLAYQVFDSPRVIECLSAYFQDDPMEDFKRDVRKAYHNKKITVAQVQAMTLHAKLNGWGTASLPSMHGRDAEPAPSPKPPPETVPQFFVGQRLTERDAQGIEHVGIVRALDADGRPSVVEEIQ